jgi:hypothetical protein
MTSTTAGVSVKRRRRRRLTVDDQLLISVGVRGLRELRCHLVDGDGELTASRPQSRWVRCWPLRPCGTAAGSVQAEPVGGQQYLGSVLADHQ